MLHLSFCRRDRLAMIVLCGLTLALAGISLAVGPARFSLETLMSAFFGAGNETTRIIVFELRLPRTLLAMAIGATMGLAGAAVQGYARNPLASPDVLGIPAFAMLGAVLVIHFGSSGPLDLLVPLAAIGFAFTGTAFLFVLVGRDSRAVSLVLAGVAMSSLAGAMTSLVLSLAPNPFAVSEIAFWLLGSLRDKSMTQVQLALPFIGVSIFLFITLRKAVLGLSLGEETARTLGISLSRTQLGLAVATACGVGASVAVAGGIGFIGLIVPHVVRPFFGYNPSRIFWPSALAGASLLTAADILVRLVPANGEVRIGVVTALIGVPFFLLLVLRERRGTALA